MARTTISLDNTIYAGGKRRQKALRYKSFSQYIEYLVAEDVEKKPEHVTVREEPGKYGKARHHRGHHQNDGASTHGKAA